QVQHQGRGDHGWVCDLFELWVLEVRVGFLPRHPFLRSFELKVYRASEQLRSINQEIDAWLKAEPMKTKWVPSDDSGLLLVADAIDESKFDQWSLIVGECVHNLRSALDNLTFAIAV